MGAPFFSPVLSCLGILQVILVGNPRCMVQSIRTEGKTQHVFHSSGEVKALVLGDGMVSWLGELLSAQATADFVLQS